MARTGKASGIKFGDPPSGRATSYDWPSIAEDLRGRPGEWAEVFTQDRHSLVSAIRNGGIPALAPSRGFASRTTNNVRDMGARICDLWMMYDPAADNGEPPPSPRCGAMTKKGEPCQALGSPYYDGRCARHKEEQ